MASPLASKRCIPCKAGTPPLRGQALALLLGQLAGRGDWNAIDEHHLEGVYAFENFRQALDFTGQVGELAEDQDHHPDLHLTWGRVRVEIWTHTIDGLTESDFVFAAKCDALADG